MIHSQTHGLARRDWLKTAALGGTAAVLSGTKTTAQPAESPAKKLKGVIFMVSDGMSPGVLTLAEALSQKVRGKSTHWWQLLDEPTAARGLMDTASANSMVTDSAAASTSWGGGQRVNNGAINVTPDGKPLTPIAEILKKSGVRTGLVSTATITHATPAGFAASVPNRGDEDAIAPQYIGRVDIALGGGSTFFDPTVRADKRDVFKEFAAAGYDVVKSRDELLASRSRKILGTFTRGHLPYSVDHNHSKTLAARVPTLSEMTKAALARLLPGDTPFLLQVEGARVDHAAHANDIAGLLWDQLAFDDAVGGVLEKLAGRDDILVVVTSDHGNANPGINGMGASYTESTRCFENILGFKASHERLFAEWNAMKNGDADQLTALIRSHLGFTLKSAEAKALIDVLANREITEWNHQLRNPAGLLGQFAGNHTGIGWTGTTHTNDPTIISATGPQAHRFAGMVRNTDVFRHLVELLG